ncbi:condensation domain-containing protein, partial [Streptomyces sp. rh34]|uniref:condensation domain-containing protein n=1 Tax=Streptomyces sp. rh34 TaxID=2034272 RepID=UPI00211D2184
MIPLSFGQNRLWLLDQFEGTGWTYNGVVQVRLRGLLDVTALDAAVSDVLKRHEVLRTVFPGDDGTPRQEVLPHHRGLAPLTVVDVPPGGLDALLERSARRPFRLTDEIAFTATLFTVSPREHVLHLVMHHIVMDGWSVRPLMRDLALAYTARRGGGAPQWEPLPVQYSEFARWQRDTLGEATDPGSLLSEQLDHWRAALAAMPEEMVLPADRARPDTPSYRGASVPFVIDAGLHRRLLDLARESRATLFMVTHAALGALFGRLGAGDDIPVGTSVAGRLDEALDDLVGFFVNTVVLRTDVSGNPTVRELIGRVRDTDLAAFDQQEAPFDAVVEAIAPRRVFGRHPLAQTMLAIHSFQPPAPDFPGLDVEVGDGGHIERHSAKFDLYFDLTETWDSDGGPAGVRGELKYATDLWDEGSARSLAERFALTLTAMAAGPHRLVSDLDLLSERERLLVTAGPARVLDRRLRLLPPGVPGELYL